MAANNLSIWVKEGNMAADNATAFPGTLLTATGDYTGAGANNLLAFTAGADGSYVRGIRFASLGTNVQTVARIYLNNGSANTTAANNILIGQLTLPATTASNTVATAELYYPLDFLIEAGFRIYVGIATTVAAGWKACVIGGNY